MYVEALFFAMILFALSCQRCSISKKNGPAPGFLTNAKVPLATPSRRTVEQPLLWRVSTCSSLLGGQCAGAATAVSCLTGECSVVLGWREINHTKPPNATPFYAVKNRYKKKGKKNILKTSGLPKAHDHTRALRMHNRPLGKSGNGDGYAAWRRA